MANSKAYRQPKVDDQPVKSESVLDKVSAQVMTTTDIKQYAALSAIETALNELRMKVASGSMHLDDDTNAEIKRVIGG